MKFSWAKTGTWIFKHKLVSALFCAWVIYQTRSLWLWPFAHFARWRALRVGGFARENGKILALKTWSRLYLFAYRKTLTQQELMSRLKEINEIYRSSFVAVSEVAWPHSIFLQEWFVFKPAPESWQNVPIRESQKWSLYLGLDALGKELWFEPPRRGHLFVAGASGSGKSVLARNIVSHFERSGYQKLVVSTKSKDFAMYSDFQFYDRSPDDRLMKALKDIDEEVTRRRERMQQLGVFDVEHTDFKPILILIDEAAWVLRAIKKTKENETEATKQADFQERISRHLRQSRDVGVLCVLCSQRAVLEELEAISGFRSSVTVISGRLESATQSQALFGSDLCFSDPTIQQGRGVFLMKTERGDLSFLKSPHLSPHGQKT